VLLAVEGKEADTWDVLPRQLVKHNGHPKAITQIAIDMSPAYRKGVRENFGNAQIVFDKFHVVSQVVQAVEEVRRKEARQDAQAREQLETNQLVVAQESGEMDGWRRRALGAIEGQTAGDGSGVCHAIGVAAGVCLRDGRSCSQPIQILVSLGATEAQALASGLLEPMLKAAEMVERHLEGILGTLEAGIDHSVLGRTQQLVLCNQTQKLVVIDPLNIKIAMLYFVAGKLEIPY